MRRLLLPFLAIVLFTGTIQSVVVLLVGRGRRPAYRTTVPAPPPILLSPISEPPREPARIPPRSYPAPEKSVIISEVEYHAPSDDPLEEWIELHNRGEAPVDVSGWKLVDAVDFTFPPGTLMAPGSYLVCAADRERVREASGIDGVVGNWSGSLKDGGEKIRLVTADGKDADELEYEDRAPFPALADGRGASLERRNPHLPSSLAANWGPASTGGWVRVRAKGRPSTNRLYLYLGGPGVVYVDDMVLTAEGGDAAANLIPDAGFEGGAAFWSFDGSHSRSSVTSELARSGARSLAIRASGAGSTRGTSVMAAIPNMARSGIYELSFWAYFQGSAVPLTARFSGSREGGGIHAVAMPRGATPGRPNSIGAEHPPPALYPLEHSPARPSPGDTVVVTASATSFLPVRSVHLLFDAGRGEERVPLEASGPMGASDGARQASCSARIGPFPPGTLVRYRAVIEDGSGGKGTFPPGDAASTLAFFVEDPARIEPATPGVPVYHFLLDPALVEDLDANVHSDEYRKGIFMGEGKVHCDVGFRYRGQTSRWLPKKHWKVQFHPDAGLRGPEPPHARFRTINLNSGYGDKSFLREMLGFQLWRDMGEAYCETWHSRAYLNGEYLGLYIAIENPNGDFLERNRLKEGWLWKSYSTGDSLGGGFELEQGDPTSGAAALASFLEGINELEGESLEAFIEERMNVDSFVNYLAGCQLIHQADAVAKNYLLYADPEGKFTMFPWDLDLTHGRNYECSGGGIWNDTIRHDMWERETGDEELLYGTRANPKCGDSWNAIIDAFLVKTHAFRAIYYKKLSEHLAHFYHPDVLVPRIEELRAQLREEVARDRARWGAYGGDVDFDRQCDILIRWTRLRFKHLSARLAKLGYPVGSAFSARFKSPERVGTAPFAARFRSACVGKVESLEWDFGDGTKESGEAPEHTYEKPGTYDVRLRAKGPEGEHEIVRRDWVRVKGASR